MLASFLLESISSLASRMAKFGLISKEIISLNTVSASSSMFSLTNPVIRDSNARILGVNPAFLAAKYQLIIAWLLPSSENADMNALYVVESGLHLQSSMPSIASYKVIAERRSPADKKALTRALKMLVLSRIPCVSTHSNTLIASAAFLVSPQRRIIVE
uniref:Uncharacterized protein n=1 Tax=Arundo donax TaxID=35708 RepID=A0A0A9I2E5_ARUDO